MTTAKPEPLDDYDDSDHEGRDEPVACEKCGGRGTYSDCIDDLCHGAEECIHGDDATCSRCGGTGEER
jgi:hypothetical protein